MEFRTAFNESFFIGGAKRKRCGFIVELMEDVDDDDDEPIATLPFESHILSNVLGDTVLREWRMLVSLQVLVLSEPKYRATEVDVLHFECADFLDYAPAMVLYASRILKTLFHPLPRDDMLDIDVNLLEKLIVHWRYKPRRSFFLNFEQRCYSLHYEPELLLIREFLARN